ncbi:MAG TPA: KR domain-containing protein, partial [Thermoanaerobaculia bacterium]|nr:KR domain-containing protein [Thermoanaerobaculia bacterium]
GPELCVVSGPTEAVEALRVRLDAQKVECTRLHTSHAFHSEMMAPVLGPFTERASRVAFKAPKLPYLSNVTGTWIKPGEATDPGYWVRHLRQTVRFADGLAEALADPARVLLEVGPGQSLTTLAQQMPAQHPGDRLARVAVPSLRRPKDDPAEVSDLARMLQALGRLWSSGAAVTWEALTAGETRRRVPLPTYPFERQRYWIDPGQPAQAVAPTTDPYGAAPQEGLVKQSVDRWFYLPVWREEERLVPPATENGEPASWLVFRDAGPLGGRITEELRARGETVREVVTGESFEVREDGTVVLRPGERKDYDLLMKETRQAPPTRVLHLWNVDLWKMGGASFWPLLYLVQALAEESPAAEVRIGTVSQGLQAVLGDETIDPEKALVLGLCHVVPQEQARMSVHSLDVVAPVAESPLERELAARLIAELKAEKPPMAVAFRGRRRWVQAYEPVRLDEKWSRPSVLREGGAWLITGGLDPTSLVFARNLVRECGGRVALVVPPGFPTRGSWDALLASSPQGAGRPDPVARAIRTVRELEDGGGEVLLIPADPATEEGAREVVAAARERFGELRGVLHLDMFPGAGLIQLKTPDASAPVLRPKVDATRALAAALDGVPIELFALFSSTIAVTGGLGQVDFCAANNFLDAFSEGERAAGRLPAVTLDWGAFRWEEWQEQLGGGPAGMQAELKRSLAMFGIDE